MMELGSFIKPTFQYVNPLTVPIIWKEKFGNSGIAWPVHVTTDKFYAQPRNVPPLPVPIVGFKWKEIAVWRVSKTLQE